MAESGSVTVEKQANKSKLFLSSIEAFVLWEATRIGYHSGDSKDIYLEFDKDGNKLKNLYVAGKQTDLKFNRLGLDIKTLYLMDRKTCSMTYATIAINRASGYGTEIDLDIDVNKRTVSTATFRQVRAFDF